MEEGRWEKVCGKKGDKGWKRLFAFGKSEKGKRGIEGGGKGGEEK